MHTLKCLGEAAVSLSPLEKGTLSHCYTVLDLLIEGGQDRPIRKIRHPKFRSQELGFDQLALGKAEAKHPQTSL